LIDAFPSVEGNVEIYPVLVQVPLSRVVVVPESVGLVT